MRGIVTVVSTDGVESIDAKSVSFKGISKIPSRITVVSTDGVETRDVKSVKFKELKALFRLSEVVGVTVCKLDAQYDELKPDAKDSIKIAFQELLKKTS